MQTRHVLTCCRHCLRWRNSRQAMCSPVADTVSQWARSRQCRHAKCSCRLSLWRTSSRECRYSKCSPVADPVSEEGSSRQCRQVFTCCRQQTLAHMKGVTEKCSHAPCSPVADTVSRWTISRQCIQARHLLQTADLVSHEWINRQCRYAKCYRHFLRRTSEADNTDTLRVHLLQTLSPMKE